MSNKEKQKIIEAFCDADERSAMTEWEQRACPTVEEAMEWRKVADDVRA